MKHTWMRILMGMVLAANFAAVIAPQHAEAVACNYDSSTEFRSRASGNWNNANTWSCSQDNFVTANNATQVPTSSYGRVYIQNANTVTVDTSSATASSLTIGWRSGTAILTFSASGSPKLTVSGAVSVGHPDNANRDGTITFTSGSTLEAGSLTLGANGDQVGTITMTAGGYLKVNGAITVGGTGSVWTPGTGTVELTADNILPATKFTSFNNLTISSGTTTLGVTTAVNGTLTVNSGATLNVGNPSSITLTSPNSNVANNGTLQQTRTVSGSASFLNISSSRYWGVGIANGTLGSTTVGVSGQQTTCFSGHPSGAVSINSGTVERCYVITPASADTSVDVTFYYQNDELNGATVGNIYVWKYGSWTRTTASSYSACGSGIGCSVTVNGYSLPAGANYFMLGGSTSPTAVTLESMAAVADLAGAHVDVTWQTAQEIGNAGFNLYRGTSREDQNPIKLNAALIPSNVVSGEGDYLYPDSYQLVPGATYFYWLEDVPFDGTPTRHEPVTVTFAPTAVGLGSFGGSSTWPAALPFAAAAAAAALVAGAAVWARRATR